MAACADVIEASCNMEGASVVLGGYKQRVLQLAFATYSFLKRIEIKGAVQLRAVFLAPNFKSGVKF